MKNVDYLIVGQGIAGTCFALRLLQENKSFLVVDKGIKHSSSSIAAGIINPLSLKRVILSWRANDFLHFNSSFYREVSLLLKKEYHFPISLGKLISSEEDLSFWNGHYKNLTYSAFLDSLSERKTPSPLNRNILSIAKLRQVSWLNLKGLLNDFRNYLTNKGLLIEADFIEKELADECCFRGVSFKHLVFCEGARGLKNPFFKNIPFSLNKGQIITIRAPQLDAGLILKKKVFILPVNEGLEYKVGSTFSWKWADISPEKEATELLKKGVNEMISVDFNVIKEEAGIRPASKDRRPMLGRSSSVSNFYIFNGLGSKGCLMAPLLAKELFEYIEEGTPLHLEADIRRFQK